MEEMKKYIYIELRNKDIARNTTGKEDEKREN
jgi:hypothetical protein